jgi:hypothetical protein
LKYSRHLLTATAVVLVLGLVLASLISLVYAAVPWTKIPGVSLGGELYVVDVEVIKDGGTYEMWYTHGKTTLSLTEIASSLIAMLTDDIVNDIANLDLASLLSDLSAADISALYDFLVANSTVIGYATSPDGTTWTVVDTEVLAGGGAAWDSVASPSVVKTAGSYQMWYTHASIDLTLLELQTILTDLANPLTRRDAMLTLMASINSVIGYATSNNGTTWTVVDPEVLAGSSGGIWDSVGSPSVVRTDSTTYEIWYTRTKTSLTQAEFDTIIDNIATFGMTELMSILDATSSVIDYTTSVDGVSWAVPQEVLAGTGGGVWDSVASPSVVKTAGSYQMWYTQATTDLTSVEIQTLVNEIQALDLTALWTAVKSGDLIGLFTELVALIDFDMVAIKNLLANSSGVIGYAASTDGVSWQVQQQPAMVGASGSPWSSVGSPSVTYSNPYEMWHVQGIDQLTTTNLVAIMQGIILPVGYATFPGNSVDLVSGWNFVGLPVSLVSPDINDALAGIIGDVEIVWYFDGTTATWSFYIPGGPPPTLNEMTEGKGYWVKITNPTTLGVIGIEPPLPYDIPLVADWNLISLPETPSPSTIVDVLAGIIGDVEIVWYYDGATATWSFYIPGGPPPTLNNMTEGKAYWIKMTNPNTLTIS